MAEWITAIGTIGTFVVIAASAIAALLQLRHMRSGNQIAAYNECRETMDAPDFRTALGLIRSDLTERLREPGVADEIIRQSLPGEYASIRHVANLFESMGLFVRIGMMDRKIACELWSGIVLDVWNRLRPLTAAARRNGGDGIWINFEYMAALASQYIDSTEGEKYPEGVPRMPLDTVSD
ncbi:MAG TPA: hypothetical protein VFL13_13835 [Candidatus Baltobacteraceae bacterium]|nr:hypothetical protein [Candidatus Baltobacteraceae bacterium]